MPSMSCSIAAPGGPGCFPRLRFCSARSAARRSLLLRQQRCLPTDQRVTRILRRQRLSHARIMPETTPGRPPGRPNRDLNE
jgi:hypothetical protein